MSLHFHELTVREVRPDTDEAVLLSFELPETLAETFRFEAGQYLTLRAEVGGEDLRRSYSICAAPRDGVLRVGVRRRKTEERKKKEKKKHKKKIKIKKE